MIRELFLQAIELLVVVALAYGLAAVMIAALASLAWVSLNLVKWYVANLKDALNDAHD